MGNVKTHNVIQEVTDGQLVPTFDPPPSTMTPVGTEAQRMHT
jgi:hypothetical protein